ncbi:MAG: hypothetical protein ACKVQS_01900 [Fimbriimonadaceae bacterium]
MHKQVNELQNRIDRFVAVSLLINDELLDADLSGLTDLFDQRERCLSDIQDSLSNGGVINDEQKILLSQQDEYTVSLINRLRGDLRKEIDRSNQGRRSRIAYSETSDSLYELTG